MTDASNSDTALLDRLLANQSPAGLCFDTLVTYAASRRATDFFCAPNRDGFDLFMRCEGSLFHFGTVTKSWGEHLINHTKVVAGIPIEDRRHPHDGRLVLEDGSHSIDLRIGTMPTFFGEELAVRILDSRLRLMEISELGLLPQQESQFQRLNHARSGITIVSGRTGSGKTTTLYAMLHHLNDGSRKINTLEDPVECDIPGVYQSQVDHETGQSFVVLLRALLRHAPDVIMVGEIRDMETARVAVHAAVAGQAVFATLHAPAAAYAIAALVQLGVHPHIVASAVNGVISQEMLRRPCGACSVSRDLPPAPFSLDAVQRVLGQDFTPTFRTAVGCEECRHRGYRGLTGVFEILNVSPDIGDLIRNGENAQAIANRAVEEGTLSLSTSAQIAVARGAATFEDAALLM